MNVLLDPHGDDAALFASFTVMREKPTIIVVYDSYIQVERGHAECDWKTRRWETQQALGVLLDDKYHVEFCGLRDDTAYDARDVARAIHAVLPAHVDHCWSPAWENGGHPHHNKVAEAAAQLFTSDRVHWYLTYTTRGKSRSAISAPIPDGTFIRRKLKALSCFGTQIENMALGCWPHFMDLFEYQQ